MKKKKQWNLDPSEVEYSGTGSSSGKTGQFSRKLKITGSSITLRHTPTGIEVKGEIPRGHYSKNEMKEKKIVLGKQLFEDLENLVAKQLGIPGR
jgi:protein subunit release factor A